MSVPEVALETRTPAAKLSPLAPESVERFVADIRARETRRQRLILIGQFAIFAVILLLWESATSSVVSSPQRVLAVLWAWAHDLARWNDLRVTLQTALTGFAIGASLAIVVGLLCGSFPRFYKFISPFLMGAHAVPKVAVAPVMIFIFGLGPGSKVILAVIVSFFLVVWNVAAGFKSIDRMLIDNARVLGANRRWIIQDIYLPAIFGGLMTSLRLAVMWSILAALYGEYLGSYSGVGNMLARAQARLNADEVMAALLLIGFVGLGIERLLAWVERRAARWQTG